MPFIAPVFRNPLGDGLSTPANDGDGFYVAFGFNEQNESLSGSSHMGADWNSGGGGDTDLDKPVYAIGNATVVAIFSDQAASTTGFGKYIVLRHDLPPSTLDNGKLADYVHSLYAHLDSIEELTVGDQIEIGQHIGELGSSGNAGAAHFYLEITLGNTLPTSGDGYNPSGTPSDWVDPIAFVEARSVGILLEFPSSGRYRRCQ